MEIAIMVFLTVAVTAVVLIALGVWVEKNANHHEGGR
jgi:hypothetical protein